MASRDRKNKGGRGGKIRLAEDKKNGEEKGGNYLERANIWPAEEKKNKEGKGRKYLLAEDKKNGKGKGGRYLVSGG